MILKREGLNIKGCSLAARTALLTLCLLWILTKPAYAVSTDQAAEPVDTAKECSLTLTYGDGEKKFAGMEINLYHIADITEDYEFDIDKAFALENVNLKGIRSQEMWSEVITTLNAYIVGEGVECNQQAVTNKQGQVHFSKLTPGIYFVKWTHNETADRITGFEPSLITVPVMDSQGNWSYDVEAYPKTGGYETDSIAMSVSKLWEDIDYEESRPDTIDVDIYKNGMVERTVTLSEECSWVYTWQTEDVDAEWVCVEKKIPAKYVMTVDKRDTNFIITNSISGGENNVDNLKKSPDSPVDNQVRTAPDTGDTMDVWKYLTILCISVIALLLVSAYVVMVQGTKKR